jgi:hypothetical protein
VCGLFFFWALNLLPEYAATACMLQRPIAIHILGVGKPPNQGAFRKQARENTPILKAELILLVLLLRIFFSGTL